MPPARAAAAPADREPAPLLLRHAFLQAVMARAYLLESDAKLIAARVLGPASDSGYLELLADCNAQLHAARLGLTLRRVKFPGDGLWYLGLANEAADAESRRGAKYLGKDGRPDARVYAFYGALLERIACAPDAPGGVGAVDAREALNLPLPPPRAPDAPPAAADGAGPSAAPAPPPEPLPRLSLPEREAALARLAVDGWLAHAAGRVGAYSLGPRAYLELGALLLEFDLPPAARAALEAALP